MAAAIFAFGDICCAIFAFGDNSFAIVAFGDSDFVIFAFGDNSFAIFAARYFACGDCDFVSLCLRVQKMFYQTPHAKSLSPSMYLCGLVFFTVNLPKGKTMCSFNFILEYLYVFHVLYKILLCLLWFIILFGNKFFRCW